MRGNPAKTASSIYHFVIQMSRYGPDHCRIFNAGYDPDINATRVAGFYTYIENTLQSLCPGYRSPFFGRDLACIINWAALFMFAPPTLVSPAPDTCYWVQIHHEISWG